MGQLASRLLPFHSELVRAFSTGMELLCWLNECRSNLLVQSDQVPTLPEVSVGVLRIAQQVETCMHELIRVIRMNAAIVGRVIQFVNSPLFEIRRTAATTESADVLPGTRFRAACL